MKLFTTLEKGFAAEKERMSGPGSSVIFCFSGKLCTEFLPFIPGGRADNRFGSSITSMFCRRLCQSTPLLCSVLGQEWVGRTLFHVHQKASQGLRCDRDDGEGRRRLRTREWTELVLAPEISVLLAGPGAELKPASLQGQEARRRVCLSCFPASCLNLMRFLLSFICNRCF